MIDEILALVSEVPFHPFTIVTSSGRHYRVPSVDHLNFSPGRKVIGIWHDNETFTTISPLHIVAIDGETSATAQSA